MPARETPPPPHGRSPQREGRVTTRSGGPCGAGRYTCRSEPPVRRGMFAPWCSGACEWHTGWSVCSCRSPVASPARHMWQTYTRETGRSSPQPWLGHGHPPAPYPLYGPRPTSPVPSVLIWHTLGASTRRSSPLWQPDYPSRLSAPPPSLVAVAANGSLVALVTSSPPFCIILCV